MPGDLTVCAYCATVVIFDDELQLQLPGPHLALDEVTKKAVEKIVRAVKFLRGIPT